MGASIARATVRVAAALIPGHAIRERYREQWLADVEGADSLGMSALPVALGAATAALRLAVTQPRPATVGARRPLALGISPRRARTFGLAQLTAAAPLLFGFAIYAAAKLHLTNVAPLDWLPRSRTPGGVLLMLAVVGLMAAGAMAPVGLVLAASGRGATRWWPLAGTIVTAAVFGLALSPLGEALMSWLDN